MEGTPLGNPFDALYDRASALFDRFQNETHLQISRATKDSFTALIAARVRRRGPLPTNDEKALAAILLPLMVEQVELPVMIEIDKWIEQKFPGS